MPAPQYQDLEFPPAGLDVAGPHGVPRAGATPAAANVRLTDPGTGRRRGAARPGLARYVGERVGGLDSVIQHLNVLVDPTTEALTIADDPFNVDGPGSTADPSTNTLRTRNPGRYVRTGGSGDQPNRNGPAAPAPQFKGLAPDFPDSGATAYTHQITFDANVRAGSLIVVVVNLTSRGDATFLADVSGVTDSLGNTYALAAAEGGEMAGDGAQYPLVALYWTRSTAAGACTVTVAWTTTDVDSWQSHYVIAEYPGPWVSTPVDASAGGRGAAASGGPYSVATAAFGPLGSDRLVLAGLMAFANLGAGQTVTPAADFTVKAVDGTLAGVRWTTLASADTGPTGVPGGLTPGLDVGGTLGFNLAWACCAVAFRRA